LLIIGGVALLLIGTCYGAFLIYRHSQRQALIAQAAKDMEAKMEAAHSPDVWGMRRRGREEMDGLDRSGGREAFGQAGAEYLNRFFAMSKEEQIAEMNLAIDRRLAERKKREEERKAKEAADAAAAAAGASTDGSAANSSQNGGNSNGGPGRRGSQTDQQRLQQREGFKENVPPAARAQMTVYRQMMQSQMQSRGVSGGGGFF